MKFRCPNCSQSIEAPVEIAGSLVNCPTCQKEFIVPAVRSNWAAISVAAVLGFIACMMVYVVHRAQADAAQEKFLRGINPERGELAFETQDRIKKEAEAEMLKGCSNYIGFSRIVDHVIWDVSDQDPTNWQANATLDFVNTVGGVERTNLIFRVFKFDHRGFAVVDELAMERRREAEMARRDEFERKYQVGRYSP